MEKEENILGTEKISKLIKRFSIPCIISLLVNSLYNIVDQIFIGWGVGYLGNGATNVVFPLTMVCLAFALMFGDGASAYLSLKLGEKKKRNINFYNNFCIIVCRNLNIFATIIKCFWMYRKFRKICSTLWWNNCNRFTFYDDWDNIKLYYKSRWKSKICNDFNGKWCNFKYYIRSYIYICI